MSKLNRIKAVLAEQEKTSKWLAEQVGKSACTVSKWCSNSSQPDLQTLARIADILEVDKRNLLTGSSNLTSTAK
jgi:transcriptional regulator with XRE-family HTH domain